MQALDPLFPVYALGQHKGYGTKQHRDALAKHEHSIIHRIDRSMDRSFDRSMSRRTAYFLSARGGARSCGKLFSATSCEREEVFFASSVVFSTRVPFST